MHGVDYYQVLGVPMSADSAQIKATYKVLAKKFHPDLNGDVKKMASINEAYRVLSDPQARHRYNQTLDVPKASTRRHNDASYEYVYTPHTYQRSATSTRPRPQPTRSRAYSSPKPKQSTMGKWAWATTFAVLLGILFGTGLRNPIPNGAASTLGVTTPTTTQQTPSTSQQSPATPSNTLHDTPPSNTPIYTDPTSSSDPTQSDTNSTTQQPCSKYRKYSRNYENCINRSTNCSSDSYYSYLDC